MNLPTFSVKQHFNSFYKFLTSDNPLSIKNCSALIIFISLCVVIFYAPAFSGYFQGDEWYYFKQFLPFTRHWYGIFEAFYKSIADSNIVSGGGHLDPIYNVVWFLHNQFFGLNFTPYITLSIITHIINSVLVFILTKKLLKQNLAALLASTFFALSEVHQQAVTWVMAYIPTEISVMFFLLALIFLLKPLDSTNHKDFKRNILICFSTSIAALLTKETTIILFVLIPLLVVLKSKNIKQKLISAKPKFKLNNSPSLPNKAFKTIINNLGFRLYLISLIFYFPYRFLLPKFFDMINSFSAVNNPTPMVTSSLPWDLNLFRLITYPFKLITEVFIPYYWILSAAENITTYAYPSYASEKVKRGIDFLIFTQSAGSDMFIYLISFLFILIFAVALRISLKRNDRNKSNALICAGSIIFLSALPLLAIPTYAPGWGYLTFIDSRHIYIASIGAAIIFAIAINYLSGSIYRKTYIIFNKVHLLKMKISPNNKFIHFFTVLILVSFWMVLNYLTIQNDFELITTIGIQRKKIISTILNSIPDNLAKKVILITSDTPYYGFPPIPPFQTNLGQILALQYYQKHDLPLYFVNNDFLTKKNLMSEGYVTYQNKGFGYFIDENRLFQQIRHNVITPNDVYAFAWQGKINSITDFTQTFRKDAKRYQIRLSQFKDWRTFNDNKTVFSFQYPQYLQLAEFPLPNPNSDNISKDIALYSDSIDSSKLPTDYHGTYIRIQIINKSPNIIFPDFVPFLKDSDGNLIYQDFIYRNIIRLNNQIETAAIPTYGKYFKYIIGFSTSDKVIEATLISDNKQSLNNPSMPNYNKEFEDILSTISYPSDEGN